MKAVPATKRPAMAWSLCLWPVAADANMGVPVFANVAAYSWLLLVPIIAIEAYLLRRQARVTIGRAAAVAAWANLVSTLLGSFVVLAVGLAFGIAGILVLPGAQSDVAVLIALVPCFYLSVWIETAVATQYLEGRRRAEVWNLFFLANTFSYGLLGTVAVANFAKNWILHGYIVW